MSCASALGSAPDVRRERKFVALLFADVVGSTALGEREDPEVVQALISGTFSRLSQEIERFGGTVDKIMGDAILALFGVPSAHEDDPERAVRAALEMQAALAALNREAFDTRRQALDLRIGVEAGEVMVNLERTPDLPDRMVTGDAANTAARLQTNAEPGSVVVGPAVYAATNGTIEYRELPPLTLRGKSEALPAWVATGVRTIQGERRLGLEAPLAGRDEELAGLKQAFHRVASTGRPALMTVIGPAGVGKSRLAWELLKYVDGLPQPPAWMRGRCLPYGNVSYSAFADAMKERFGLRDDDPAEVATAKVEAAVTTLFGDGTFAPHLLALTGRAPERAFSREDLFDAWRRTLERDADRRPLVLLLEDIHWADDGLLDFLDYLADWGQGPILALTLARPELLESHPRWGGGKRNYAAAYVDPLTSEQSAEMLDGLLGGHAPDELRALVLDRTEGNPLFTEEIVRALIDQGGLRASGTGSWELAVAASRVELPRSVQGVIASRVDGLPAEEKRILQDASVIGRAFWVGAVASLSGQEADAVRALVGRLRVKELVVPREPAAFAGDVEFGFRHALIRDVAYGSLPKGERAGKHAHVADWAERTTGSRAEEFAELIATHHVEACRYLAELGETSPRRDAADRATLRWAVTAGDRAERVKDLTEAIRWYEHAVDAARGLPAPQAELAALLERLGDIRFPAGKLAGADEAYREAATLRLVEGAEADLGRLEAKSVFAGWYAGRGDELMDVIDRAVARLEPFGDGPDLAFALVVQGASIAFLRGQDGSAACRRGVEMARAASDRATLAQGLTFLGTILVNSGRALEGIPVLEEAETLSRELGDVEAELMAFGLLADALNSHQEVPEPDRVDALIADAADLGRKGGRELRLERTLDSVAWFSFQRGRLDRAEEALREQLEIARRNDLPFEGPILLMQAWVASVRGDIDDAARLGAEGAAKTTFPSVRRPIVEGAIASALGEAERATQVLVDGAAEGVFTSFEAGVELEYLLIEAVRAALAAGRAGDAVEVAGRLRHLADDRAAARPFARWAEGVLSDDPEAAVGALREAVAGFTLRRQPIDQGRCSIDLARALRDLGEDPLPSLEAARGLLAACGAGRYVAEVDAAIDRNEDG